MYKQPASCTARAPYHQIARLYRRMPSHRSWLCWCLAATRPLLSFRGSAATGRPVRRYRPRTAISWMLWRTRSRPHRRWTLHSEVSLTPLIATAWSLERPEARTLRRGRGAAFALELALDEPLLSLMAAILASPHYQWAGLNSHSCSTYQTLVVTQ